VAFAKRWREAIANWGNRAPAAFTKQLVECDPICAAQLWLPLGETPLIVRHKETQGWSSARRAGKLGIISTAVVLLAASPLNPGGTRPPEPLAIATPGAADQVVQAGAPSIPTEALPVSVKLTSPTGAAAPAPSEGINHNEIVVSARPRTPGDPLEKVNVKSFAVTQAVDEAVVGPVALAYEHTLPTPVRSGLRNFLYNLREPVVFLNFLIQIKPGKGAETFGRFAINSTIGGAGLFDVAKRHPFNLPRRPNGFADSMGFYGVKPGPFLFLPLIGPTTVRDLLGDGVDRLVLPLAVGAPFNRLVYTVPAAVVGALDRRAEFDEQLRKLRESADPYSARREFYLRGRQAEIDHLRGKPRRAGSVADVTSPAFASVAPSAMVAETPTIAPSSIRTDILATATQ
jgi:phospholipid-binding lipoprotein MlaA